MAVNPMTSLAPAPRLPRIGGRRPMSHPEQLAFFSLCAAANEGLLRRGRVIEIGAYDVNGSVRSMFASASEYCGVDLVEGPGVDRVAYGHELNDPDGSWDVALSAECFEHDPMWRETLATMVRLTRPGGLVAVSCASRGRVEHGTRRTSTIDSPGTQFEGLDYYRNVLVSDVRSLPLDQWFSEWRTWYNATSADLYLAGVRATDQHVTQADIARLPTSSEVSSLKNLMPLRLRLLRWPLQILAMVVRAENSFQRWAVPYWRAVTKAVSVKDAWMAKGSRLVGRG